MAPAPAVSGGCPVLHPEVPVVLCPLQSSRSCPGSAAGMSLPRVILGAPSWQVPLEFQQGSQQKVSTDLALQLPATARRGEMQAPKMVPYKRGVLAPRAISLISDATEQLQGLAVGTPRSWNAPHREGRHTQLLCRKHKLSVLLQSGSALDWTLSSCNGFLFLTGL